MEDWNIKVESAEKTHSNNPVVRRSFGKDSVEEDT